MSSREGAFFSLVSLRSSFFFPFFSCLFFLFVFLFLFYIFNSIFFFFCFIVGGSSSGLCGDDRIVGDGLGIVLFALGLSVRVCNSRRRTMSIGCYH